MKTKTVKINIDIPEVGLVEVGSVNVECGPGGETYPLLVFDTNKDDYRLILISYETYDFGAFRFRYDIFDDDGAFGSVTFDTDDIGSWKYVDVINLDIDKERDER